MTDSNYLIEHYVSCSSARNSGVHQVTKDYEIEVSDSVDITPSIDVYVARNEKLSIQVPKSTKYHKDKRIQSADFLKYFNQTLYKLILPRFWFRKLRNRGIDERCQVLPVIHISDEEIVLRPVVWWP